MRIRPLHFRLCWRYPCASSFINHAHFFCSRTHQHRCFFSTTSYDAPRSACGHCHDGGQRRTRHTPGMCVVCVYVYAILTHIRSLSTVTHVHSHSPSTDIHSHSWFTHIHIHWHSALSAHLLCSCYTDHGRGQSAREICRRPDCDTHEAVQRPDHRAASPKSQLRALQKSKARILRGATRKGTVVSGMYQ